MEVHKIYISSGTVIFSPSTFPSDEYISKPTSVKNNNDILLGEIPFCRVKDKIDMRESEDDNGLTRIEYTRDKEENGRDRISVCVKRRER